MAPTSKDTARRLYEIAQGQQGLFTTKQAKQAGYLEEAHVYHVKMGNWIRERRGIYRLARFPPTERPDLVLWHLWSCDRREVPQGVFSHQTALSLYELSDVNPSGLHMTVPKSFRRRAPIPDVLVLHFGDVPNSDTEVMQGFRTTRPLRTVIDLLADGNVSIDLVSRAFDEAMKKGLITVRDVERRAGKLTGGDPFEALRRKVLQ